MINTKISVLILQHPAEQDLKIGTGPLIAETLQNLTIRTGLSWPNFEKALGHKADPKKWAVLYLGSVPIPTDQTLVFIDRNNKLINPTSEVIEKIEGIVALDGTWSQAKALWWRNPWLLKLNRIAIRPFQPSLYGKLRKEPRAECISTLEAVAAALVAFGEPIAVSRELYKKFREQLKSFRANKAVIKVKKGV